MNNPLDFSGQVAVVTGAAAGMGLATAQAFAEAGAAVVLADFKKSCWPRTGWRIPAIPFSVIGSSRRLPPRFHAI